MFHYSTNVGEKTLKKESFLLSTTVHVQAVTVYLTVSVFWTWKWLVTYNLGGFCGQNKSLSLTDCQAPTSINVHQNYCNYDLQGFFSLVFLLAHETILHPTPHLETWRSEELITQVPDMFILSPLVLSDVFTKVRLSVVTSTRSFLPFANRWTQTKYLESTAMLTPPWACTYAQQGFELNADITSCKPKYRTNETFLHAKHSCSEPLIS